MLVRENNCNCPSSLCMLSYKLHNKQITFYMICVGFYACVTRPSPSMTWLSQKECPWPFLLHTCTRTHSIGRNLTSSSLKGSMALSIYIGQLTDVTFCIGSPLRRRPSAHSCVTCHLDMALETVLVWGLLCLRLNWLWLKCWGSSLLWGPPTQRCVQLLCEMTMISSLHALQVPLETVVGITMAPKNGVFVKVIPRD